MSRADSTMSKVGIAAVESLIAALPGATLLYDSRKKLVTANQRGREALVTLATAPDDPWGIADLSLDLLLHRVQMRAAESAVATLHDSRGASIGEARATRIALTARSTGALVTIVGLPGSGGLELERQALGSRLLPGLAHDVRGPLTAISGLAQVLSSISAVPADIRNHAASVPNMIDRTDELLRNAVSLARPNRPDHDLPASINDAVEQAQSLMAFEVRTCSRQLEVELDRGLPRCDTTPDQLLHLVLAIALAWIDADDPPPAVRVSTSLCAARRVAVQLESIPFAPQPQRLAEARSLLERLGGTLETGTGRITAEIPAIPIELLGRPRCRLLLVSHDLDRLLAWEDELQTPMRPVALASSVAVAERLIGLGRGFAASAIDLAIARQLESPLPIPALLIAGPGEERDAASFAQTHHVQSSAIDDVAKSLIGLLA